MKNGATPSQVRSWDDCPGPFTWGAGVGTGGTSRSGCAGPISDEAVIGHPWSNQAKAGATQGDARKRSSGSGIQHAEGTKISRWGAMANLYAAAPPSGFEHPPT